MFNHVQACWYCPKHFEVCSIYSDVSWVNRRGGCPSFPLRDLPENYKAHIRRVGQQKQRHSDRAYSSKNDRRTKFKRYD
jgi:hypothetical protein